MIIDSPIISGSYSASGSLNQFGNVVISGSLTVTGSIIGTASFASTASYLSGYVSPFPFTGSAIISGSLDVTGSLKVTGSITSTGTITAQTLVVQTVSSSVIYSSGSNVFGNDLANTQRLTGSVSVTGSLAVNGSNAVLTNQTSSMSASYAANATSASSAISSSFANTAGSLVTTSNYQMASLGVGTAPVAPFKGNFYGQVIVQNGINNATGQQSLIFAYPGITNNLTHSIWSGHDNSVANYNKLDFYISKTDGTTKNVLSLRSSQPVLIGSDTGLGLTVSGSTVISGSLTSTTGITGSLLGTSSFANNATSASYALTASFSLNVPVTASYANNANSASYASTASFATTASYLSGYVSPFPFTGSAIISGSLTVTGSANLPNITGSLQGTASYALSSSFATTASYLSGYVSPFPFTGSAIISGSLAVTGSLTITGSNTLIGTKTITGSVFITGSKNIVGTTTVTGSLFVTGSQTFIGTKTITGSIFISGSKNIIGTNTVTGSMLISGSTGISGSLTVNSLSGSGVRYLVADESGSITAQSASAALKSTQAFVSTAGQTTFSVTNGYSTGYVDVFINGSKLATAEFTDTSGTNIVLATGSFVNDIVEVVKYTPALGVTNNVLRQLTTFTGSAGQTVFSASYTPGLLDIFYNGSRLSPADFTANNGTFFTLATGSAANDILDVLVYSYQVGAFSGIGGAGVTSQIAYFNTTSSITGSNNFTISGSTMTVTGSLTVSGSGTFTNIGPAVFSGSITSTAGFTGSFSGTATSASYAANAELLDGLDSSVFILTSSFAAQTASFTAFTSSINTFSASILSYTSSINAKTSSFATTGSNTFIGTQTISGSILQSGSFTSTGTLTAQTLVVQTITSSTVYSSGSNVFGNSLTNTQVFSGSVSMNPGGLFVSSSGNVGIGTSTPTTKFDLAGTIGNFQIASSGAEIFLTRNENNDILATGGTSSAITIGAQSFLKFKVGTSYTERMIITSTGKVGIGTTSPAELLEVSGSLKIGNLKIQNVNGGSIGLNRNTADGTIYNSGYAAFQINGAYAGADYLHFQNYNSSGSYVGGFVLNNGNFGIGLTNPSSIFQVASAQSLAAIRSTTTTNYAEVQIENTTNYLQIGVEGATGNRMGGTIAYNSYLGSYANYGMTFHTNNLNRMTITAGGNVGINKTNPDSKLSIVDSSYNNYSLRLESQSGNTSGRWGGIGFAGESVNTKAGIFFVSEGGSYSRGNLVFCNNSDFNQNNVTTADARMTITKEGNIGAPSGTNIYNASDVRLKQNITTITNGLNKIMGLNPVMFNWINGYVESEEGKNMLGFIAQEVQNIVPEAVESFSDGSNITVGESTIENPLRVNEKFIIPVLVKAIQELQEKLERNNIN